ncbi:MAG: ATP-binding protein [Bacteroidales bacterium]|nr:ATP-binding protein [Bacteroidales bacterium]
MIERSLDKLIAEKLFKGKAIVLIGARQVGKTTLLKNLVKGMDSLIWLNGDDIEVRTLLQNVSTMKLKSLLGKNKTLVIDEAQRIENIGLKMKLVTDNFVDVQLILTGSSSFDLANKINEPLTGRKWEYTLFPLSFGELANHNGTFDEIRHLPLRLVYGSYPDVVNNPGDEREILMQLTNSYLYKDILEWERIRKPDKLVRLLQALAFQVGSEVSLNELGTLVELDKNTVEKYITLLEQTQVIFRLPSLSRNMRNELKMSRKVYFHDNGIRNALISNFSDIDTRNDVGALWENWIISELRKKRHYEQDYVNTYFWRTTQQQEIDYIEEKDGHFTAYEFKWNPQKKAKMSQTFLNAYPNTTIKTINRENFYEYLLTE